MKTINNFILAGCWCLGLLIAGGSAQDFTTQIGVSVFGIVIFAGSSYFFILNNR